jgi:general secretion pathway protein A
MYEKFYGLKENPFNMTPDPHFIYLGENHREALAHLVYGVTQKKGFIAITGEVGTGKTTLIRYLLSQLNGSDHTKTAFLFNPKLTVTDFFEYILKDLGVNVQGGTKGNYLHALNQTLLNAYQSGEKVVLIVDEAQGLSPALLEEIRLLSNFETTKSKLLQIVLVGQPELDKTLKQPKFRQIRQRINMRYHLNPLSQKGTKEYIEKRLQIAGAKGPLLTKSAIREIYRISRGIPRLINILCDNSLLNGYAQDRRIIDKKLVKEAAKDLKLGGKFRNFWHWVLPGIFIIGGIVFIMLLIENTQFGDLLAEFLNRLQSLKEIVTNGINSFFKFL